MSDTNYDIENILKELSTKNLHNNIAEIFNNPKEYPVELIDKLSIETALRYWNGKIDYTAGYWIMNHLFHFWLSKEQYFKNHDFSEVAKECYDAFDAGEYFHKGDDHSINPIEKHTKLYIESLLRKRGLI